LFVLTASSSWAVYHCRHARGTFEQQVEPAASIWSSRQSLILDTSSNYLGLMLFVLTPNGMHFIPKKSCFWF